MSEKGERDQIRWYKDKIRRLEGAELEKVMI